MRDWQKIVQHELAMLDLPPKAKNEVIDEVVSHFEDCDLHGAREPQLRGRQWSRFSRAIQLAKTEEGMNWTKAASIPIFINLLLSSVVINLCNWLGWIDVRITQPVPVSHALQPWLLTLPLCGATAAFLTRRSKGSPAVRILAALSPSLVWLGSIPIVQLIFICFPNVFATIPLSSMATAAMGWFVFPAFALFLGAIPFLIQQRPQVNVE